MAYAKTSERREKRLLREQMRSMGLGYRDIAAEFARRYRLRPRAAWRDAYGWSLQDTADRINEFRGNIGLDPGGFAGMTAPHLSEYENWPGHGPKPTGRRPTPYLLAVLAAVYDCTVADLVDLADRERLPAADILILDKYSQTAARPASRNQRQVGLPHATRQQDDGNNIYLPGTKPAVLGADTDAPHRVLSVLGQDVEREEDPLRRGTFTGLAGPPAIDAVLAEAASGVAPAESGAFASVLTRNTASPLPPEPGPPPEIGTLAAEVDNVRRDYQACRYTELASQLPGLLARLELACVTLTGDVGSKACTLSADAHHVAAGLLLKLDDQGLASLAADRSMRAAQASGDPVTIGASARIITHTLMSGGHMPAAVTAASDYAAQLNRAWPPTPLIRCPSTGRCCCAGRSPQHSTATAEPPTSSSTRPTRQQDGSAWTRTATIAGLPSGQPTPCCTA